MQTVFWTDIKKHHIEKKLEKLFPLFVKSLIDDEIFDDYNDIILSRLVKTSFDDNGLDEKAKVKAIKLLK